MSYGLEIVTPPESEPITLAEAKSHLRVTIDDDDDDIDALIRGAREWVEEEIGIQLIAAEYDLVLDRFPVGGRAMLLPRFPLLGITEVKYVDLDGTTWTASPTSYGYDVSRSPGRLYPAYGHTWPTTRRHPRAVIVRFRAGHSDAAAVPDRAKAAIKLIVGHLYEHREENTELSLDQLPFGAQRLIAQLAAGDEFDEFGTEDLV